MSILFNAVAGKSYCLYSSNDFGEWARVAGMTAQSPQGTFELNTQRAEAEFFRVMAE